MVPVVVIMMVVSSRVICNLHFCGNFYRTLVQVKFEPSGANSEHKGLKHPAYTLSHVKMRSGH